MKYKIQAFNQMTIFVKLNPFTAMV